MVMIGHQTPGVNLPSRAFARLVESPQEGVARPLGGKNIRAIIASIDDVVECVRKFDSEFAGHARQEDSQLFGCQ